MPLAKRQRETVDDSAEEDDGPSDKQGAQQKKDDKKGAKTEQTAPAAEAPVALSAEFEELRQYQAAQVNLEKLKEHI